MRPKSLISPKSFRKKESSVETQRHLLSAEKSKPNTVTKLVNVFEQNSTNFIDVSQKETKNCEEDLKKDLKKGLSQECICPSDASKRGGFNTQNPP